MNMKQSLASRWKKVPDKIRRPIVLTVGMFFVVLSGALGWLPGPGGIPLFLLGIAILSSEYHWAARLKHSILRYVHAAGAWLRSHHTSAIIAFSLLGLCAIAIVYMLLYTK